jgi:uncharacterized damage-inducible protein DinB
MLTEFSQKLSNSSSELLALFQDVSETQAQQKPTHHTWSMLECFEHIFVVESGIIKTLQVDATPNTQEKPETVVNRVKVETLLANRELKIEAPDYTAPRNRFKTLAEAKEAFLNKRNILANLIAQTNLQDGVIVQHPRLGNMTKLDWIHFLIQHTNRHIAQLNEIKQQIQ